MISYNFSTYSDKKSWFSALSYAVAAVLIYTIFASLIVSRAGGHPWGLLGFYRHLTLDCQKQVPERFVSSEFGYDGQAYFALALSPFVRDPATLGFRFDNQVLRHQRILYPLIVHLLAWGDSCRTAWFMLIVNVFAIGALVAVSARNLSHMGQPAWLSLLAGFYPGFAVSVSRGLTEPLCLMWVLAAIFVWRRQPWLSSGMLCLAVLTRETALLVAAGFGCAWLLGIKNKDSFAPPAKIWVLPLAAYLLWHGFLLLWVADSSAAAAALTKIGWPLVGFIGAVVKNTNAPTVINLFFLFFILITVAWQFFTAKTIKPRRDPLFWAWIFYGVLLSVAGLDIWDNSPGLLRIATEWNVLGLLLVGVSGFSRWKTVAAIWFGAWLLSAAGEWYRYGLIF